MNSTPSLSTCNHFKILSNIHNSEMTLPDVQNLKEIPAPTPIPTPIHNPALTPECKGNCRVELNQDLAGGPKINILY